MNSTVDMIIDISFELSEAYRGKIANIGPAVISTAYVLSKIERKPTISADSLEKFVKTANISIAVSEVLSRNLNGLWETVLSFVGKFDADVLEEVVLYDNSFFEMSTPASLAKLASSILEIKEQDKVLDICSGSATFPIVSSKNISLDKLDEAIKYYQYKRLHKNEQGFDCPICKELDIQTETKIIAYPKTCIKLASINQV